MSFQILTNAKKVQPSLGSPTATIAVLDDTVSVAYHAIIQTFAQRLPRSITGRAIYDVDLAFLGFHAIPNSGSLPQAFISSLAGTATELVNLALGMKNLGLPKELSLMRSTAAANMLDSGSSTKLSTRDSLTAIPTKVVPSTNAGQYADQLEYYLGAGVAKTIYLPAPEGGVDQLTSSSGFAELEEWWGRGRLLTLLDAASISGDPTGTKVNDLQVAAAAWLAIYLESLPDGQFGHFWAALPQTSNNVVGKVHRLVSLARAMNAAALAPRIRAATQAVQAVKALLAFTDDYPLWTDIRRDAIAEEVTNFEKAAASMPFTTYEMWAKELSLTTEQMGGKPWIPSSLCTALDKDMRFPDDKYGPGLATAWLPTKSQSNVAVDVFAERSLLKVQKDLLSDISKATLAIKGVQDMGAFTAESVTGAVQVSVSLPALDEPRIATAADQLPLPVGAPHITRRSALDRIHEKFFTLISWADLYDKLVEDETYVTLHRPASGDLPGLREILSLRFPISRSHLEGESADSIVVTDDFMARAAADHVAFYGAFPAYVYHVLLKSSTHHRDIALAALASTFAVLVKGEALSALPGEVASIKDSPWKVLLPVDGYAYGLKTRVLLKANAAAFDAGMELITTPGLNDFALVPLEVLPKLSPSVPFYIKSHYGLFLTHAHQDWTRDSVVEEGGPSEGAALNPKWAHYCKADWTNRVLAVPSLTLTAHHAISPALFTKRYSRLGSTVFGWRENLVGYLSPEILSSEPEPWLPSSAPTEISSAIHPDLIPEPSFTQIQPSSGADTSKGAQAI